MNLTRMAFALVVATSILTVHPFAISQSITSPTSQASAADLRGIYVDSNAFPISKSDSAAIVQSLSVPGVDGVVLVFGWNGLEPSRQKFQWTTLDRWMTIATAAGKKVELSIRADYHTPSWLFQPAPGGGGARAIEFSFTRKPTDVTCLAETLAVPWDTSFQRQWGIMLDSVSAHLKSTGMYDAVVLLRLTGINKDSDELHLPAEATGAPCITDAVTAWQAVGYRPSLLLQGWDSTTSAFKKSFPDKSFSVAIIAVTNPFPPIAEDGSIITGTIPNQNIDLLALASQKFPGHFVIQNNSLYPGLPAQSETVQSAESLKTMIAFQTNEELKGLGAACGGRGDTTHCTDSTYLAELQTGIYPLGPSDSLRAQYIEVFAYNVNATPAAILQAHNELFGATTGVFSPGQARPGSFRLEQNFPNPFNPTTTIVYTIAGSRENGVGSKEITIVVYDMLGKVVATLVNGWKSPGTYTVQFNASGLASGEYVYEMKSGSFVASRQMLLIK